MSDVSQGAQVGLIMGSDSDWPTMEAAAEALAEFGIRFEVGVISAHRTPQRMLDYAANAAGRAFARFAALSQIVSVSPSRT